MPQAVFENDFQTSRTEAPSRLQSHVASAFVLAVSTAAVNVCDTRQETPIDLQNFNLSSLPSIVEPSSFQGVANDNFKVGTASPTSDTPALRADWVQACLDRIEKLGRLPKDWGGEGYCAATPDVVSDAERFLLKLVHLGVTMQPAIGLDDDGSFSFHFNSGTVLADLSVHSGGVYSYYAKMGNTEAYSDESSVDGKIDDLLAEIIVS